MLTKDITFHQFTKVEKAKVTLKSKHWIRIKFTPKIGNLSKLKKKITNADHFKQISCSRRHL